MARGFSCTFQLGFIIKIMVAIKLSLKPPPQIAIISPVIKQFLYFFFISSVKDNHPRTGVLETLTGDLFMYFIHDATAVLSKKKNPSEAESFLRSSINKTLIAVDGKGALKQSCPRGTFAAPLFIQTRTCLPY